MKTTGFPSPANDHLQEPLDLNDQLIRHPAATFFMRAGHIAMTGSGICTGDLLIVDRSLQAGRGTWVVAIDDGELTVRQVRDRHTIEVWGVITYVIRAMGD